MKAELIANIISAHCAGDEQKFEEAVKALAEDEDKKGNGRVSSLIRDAYRGKKNTLVKKPESAYASVASAGFTSTASANGAPRDKDSYLELYDIINPTVSLNDIVLPENQKVLIHQVLDERSNNAILAEHNLPLSNRLLLCGPPGCGKTMTAYAMAHELKLPMAYVRLDGLVSSYLGQTSVNLRKIFSSLEHSDVVLFLDEFDAIAKKRDDSNEMGELKRVVTALLQNFDNMPNNIFLIAATNHEHLLDPAIWRRFNYVINFGLPDTAQRKELINRWLDEYRIERNLNVDKIADITVGRSAAQIKELVITAAKKYITSGKPVDTDAVIELLIQQLTNNANGAALLDVAYEMSKKGISIRTLAKIIGMPHNTLAYQIKKRDGEVTDGE